MEQITEDNFDVNDEEHLEYLASLINVIRSNGERPPVFIMDYCMPTIPPATESVAFSRRFINAIVIKGRMSVDRTEIKTKKEKYSVKVEEIIPPKISEVVNLLCQVDISPIINVTSEVDEAVMDDAEVIPSLIMSISDKSNYEPNEDEWLVKVPSMYKDEEDLVYVVDSNSCLQKFETFAGSWVIEATDKPVNQFTNVLNGQVIVKTYDGDPPGDPIIIFRQLKNSERISRPVIAEDQHLRSDGVQMFYNPDFAYAIHEGTILSTISGCFRCDTRVPYRKRTVILYYYCDQLPHAFDILWQDGKDLRKEPYLERLSELFTETQTYSYGIAPYAKFPFLNHSQLCAIPYNPNQPVFLYMRSLILEGQVVLIRGKVGFRISCDRGSVIVPYCPLCRNPLCVEHISKYVSYNVYDIRKSKIISRFVVYNYNYLQLLYSAYRLSYTRRHQSSIIALQGGDPQFDDWLFQQVDIYT